MVRGSLCVAAFSQFRDPNAQTPEACYFLLELVPGGELFGRLAKMPNGQVSDEEANFFAACTIEALQHMHSSVASKAYGLRTRRANRPSKGWWTKCCSCAPPAPPPRYIVEDDETWWSLPGSARILTAG